MGVKNCCCCPVWKSTFGGNKKVRRCCSTANGIWLLVMVPGAMHRLWSDIRVLWARLSMIASARLKQTFSPKYQGIKKKTRIRLSTRSTAKSNCLQLVVSDNHTSSPPTSIFQSRRRRKEFGIPWAWIRILVRDFCCCCCEGSLGKMKPLLADNLVVSLMGSMGIEQEEDATALFPVGTLIQDLEKQTDKRRSEKEKKNYLDWG